MSAPIEYYLGCISRLEAQRDTLEQERDELRDKLALLTDPAAVHANILRGDLPLTKAQAIHIARLPADVEQELERLRAENAALKERIKTAINAACERCKRGDALFLEPSTGFYTHTLGGNYCSAHRYHNLLGSEAADAARRKP